MNFIDQLQHGILTEGASQTQHLAEQFAGILPPDSLLGLKGDLGAGKTTFVKGLATAWAINEDITSPTFNLFTTYRGKRNLVHVDAYRLTQSAEFEDLMIEDFLEPPFCLVIEWPERLDSDWLSKMWLLELSIMELGKHKIQLTNRPNTG